MTRRNPGGVDPDGFLAQLDVKLAAIKDATREANEAIKGIREVMREAKAYRSDLEAATQKAVDERISEAVAIGLESFQEALDGAIETGTRKTYKRFEDLTSLMLGETREFQRRGDLSFPELIRNRMGVTPHKYNPVDEQSAICLDCRFPFDNKEVHPE